MKTSKRLQQNTSTKCNNALKESHCMIKGDLSQRFIMRSFSSFSLSAIRVLVSAYLGLPRSLRKHPKNVGDLGSIPGLGRSPGRGHGNPLQHSCLENPHGQRNLVGCSPWGRKRLDTIELLSTHLHIWDCWYFSWQSWTQLVIHTAQHFAWCTLHIS